METFGDYYADKVLSLNRRKLTKRELVGYVCWDETEIKQNLFGWQVIVNNKQTFDCRSEAEARFLRVFIELGAREILVPRTDEYLTEILPRLEYLKRRAGEVYDNRMATVFSRKLREEVRRKFCRKVLAPTVQHKSKVKEEAA